MPNHEQAPLNIITEQTVAPVSVEKAYRNILRTKLPYELAAFRASEQEGVVAAKDVILGDIDRRVTIQSDNPARVTVHFGEQAAEKTGWQNITYNRNTYDEDATLHATLRDGTITELDVHDLSSITWANYLGYALANARLQRDAPIEP